ncbi:chemotaxis protein [Mammaliicoccus sciuri]|uniref:Two-component system, chemotaxis family, response regulator CheV n=1 Tax=Sporosarcina newyorkensis TaxID=759851 RepID=A0A1T4Y7J8_9BACL|nr:MULTISPECIES: chemotaxis protein [Sporosarcina]MBY0223857.1 chemotaxis protein CheV [Sporosarcina aquimarina]SKA97792.1 two-component system, chemotaxis family, response regulator CheV [Sporosarcina newyorkensis]
MANDSGILLESGTNELEIVGFEMGGNRYGINVIKVKEIIMPLPITPIPHAHFAVEGIVQLRGEVLPVVNMEKILGMAPSSNPSDEKYIVASFNKQTVVFQVHNVTQIHRISWDQIEKPSGIYAAENSQVIGVIKLDGEMLLLLDFEKIILDINPDAGINVDQVKKLGKRERSDKRLLIAEDSPLLRKLLNDTLQEAGYGNLDFYENGKDAFDYLESIVEQGIDVKKEVQLVITDIEMPQMDGHHFTRRIRENPKLAGLPVIIFSSLITDDLKHKGLSVGADDQVSKPEIAELVLKIDKYIL